MSIENPQPGDLCVWHIPQLPMKAFRAPVASIEEGRKLCGILADYDAFQFEHNVKPDYCNVNGISRWEDDGDGRFDWYDIEDDDPDADDEVGFGPGATESEDDFEPVTEPARGLHKGDEQ